VTTPTHLSKHLTDDPRPQHLPSEAEQGVGWTEFAAIMIFTAGMFNALYGMAALLNDDFFRSDELLFGDLSMWGAIYLGVAGLQVAVSLLVLRRSGVGAVLGMALAGFNAIAALAAVGAYPIWSMVILAVDCLVIYALAVHGFGYGAWGSGPE
jgi:hypothetical protein